ncbi:MULTISPECIES: tetratricopeptide repeat protein [Vibrio]|uniref:Tetratricopeptide repeat protein n=1 Tax=Vibrio neptunius TaxID=170651 RepID=A0ABS2ZZL3_9VIBR|nr:MULTISPECIES: tetratricopeptide repeat protein [Vibrio]MBN3492565.1 tetratricopeptide repeat protein [Vibrio neptunius]MBN3515062.1 tetratricopeptide repeat protein [Vibrio neptunius]MBN3548678.1 tetratricopeptide repeat protein [Vibrio neptunius]MBN3577190.1 tetratricopeptide repeat protein [Vibrio neptunius]MCH9870855.1 tetratricopeptide repeat protein [Vibrio neptunius]
MIKPFIIACFCLSVLGCQSTDNQVEKSDFQLAQTALTNGHADNALSIYKKKLENNPDDPQLLFLAGSASNQAARYDEALHYLTKGRSLNPSPEFERELGRAHLALGNVRLATDSLRRAVEENDQDEVALNSLGVSYSLQKNFREAREAFQQAINIRPDSLEYRNNLALSWMLDGQPEQSIRILYPIYQRGEATTKLRLNLALSYALQGEVDAARMIAMGDLTKAELENNLAYYQHLAEQGAGTWR